MARTTYYDESLSESSTTSTSYQDKLSLSFTPNASKDHLVIYTGDLNGDDLGEDNICRLREHTGGSNVRQVVIEPKDTSDYFSVFGMDKWTSGVSPGTQEFKVQYRAEVSNTVAIRNVRLIAIELTTNDEYTESEAQSDSTNTSYVDKATLTFTPSSVGDYLIIATAEFSVNSSTREISIKLDHNSTAYGEMQAHVDDSNTWKPWGTMVKLNLAASSQTLKIQYLIDVGTGTAKIRNAAIVALRLDDWPNAYYQEDRGTSSTSSSTYQDKTTLTQSVDAIKYLVLGSFTLEHSSGTSSGRGKFLGDGSADINETEQEPMASDSDFAFFSFYEKTMTSGSKTLKTQYNAGGGTTTIQESAIALLQVDDTPAGGVVQQQLTMMGIGA